MSAVICSVCSVYENCFCDCVQVTSDTVLDTQHMKTQRTERTRERALVLASLPQGLVLKGYERCA